MNAFNQKLKNNVNQKLKNKVKSKTNAVNQKLLTTQSIMTVSLHRDWSDTIAHVCPIDAIWTLAWLADMESFVR